MTGKPEVLTFHFTDAGDIPNHPHLPLVIYRKTITAAEVDLADEFEKRFSQGRWYAAWRWGIYPFPHYHSTAHEVLAVYRGHATLRLGYTTGTTLEVQVGDVLIIPAGVGHQNLGSSSDFQVVGGYPDGQAADLLHVKPGQRPAADQSIAAVTLPKGDPIFGLEGPLKQAWKL